MIGGFLRDHPTFTLSPCQPTLHKIYSIIAPNLKNRVRFVAFFRLMHQAATTAGRPCHGPLHTVEGLMCRQRLRGVMHGKGVRTMMSDQGALCPLDPVHRPFKAQRPNPLWVSDFTYRHPETRGDSDGSVLANRLSPLQSGGGWEKPARSRPQYAAQPRLSEMGPKPAPVSPVAAFRSAWPIQLTKAGFSSAVLLFIPTPIQLKLHKTVWSNND